MNNDVVKRNKKEKSGILAGFLFIIIAVILLFYNESRAVDADKVIGIAKDSYTEVSSSVVDENNEGKLIVTNGEISLVNDFIYDEDFNISIKSAKLNRVVEMYQWDEECKDDSNGKEVCTYTKKWSNTIIDDSNFESGHVNPDNMPYSNQTLIMSNVKLGAFNINSDLLHKLSTTEEYKELDENIASSKNLYIKGKYYVTYKEDTPQVGDVRISFLYNNAKDISIMAVQKDNTFAEFAPENTNYTIYELKESIMNGKEFINELTKTNSTLTWILRLLGTILMIAGVASILKLITYLASFIPFLGKIIINGVGIISILVGISLSLIIIAISWLAVRPLLSILLLAAVVGLIILIRKYNKRGKKEETIVQEQPVQEEIK